MHACMHISCLLRFPLTLTNPIGSDATMATALWKLSACCLVYIVAFVEYVTLCVCVCVGGGWVLIVLALFSAF